MFEQMTYEKIMADMLAEVNSEVDKREGSIIWDALAPAALELSRLYAALDEVLNEGFADTAGREYLILRANERGLIPFPATYALGLAEIDGVADAGARFGIGEFCWTVEKMQSEDRYLLRCETAGSAPNSTLGRLIPLEYMPEVNKAELVDVIEPGEDEETTESLRARYLKGLSEQSFGGNAADYIAKALLIPGVAAAKVYAAWQGGGTVKLTVQNQQFGVPDAALIERVQNLFDPPEDAGLGLGLAPIGHVVTVTGVAACAVNLSADVAVAEDLDWESLLPAVLAAVDEYLMELAKGWADNKQVIVRASQLEARILAVDGIVDLQNLRLNGAAGNLRLGEDEIPVRGSFERGELNV